MAGLCLSSARATLQAGGLLEFPGVGNAVGCGAAIAAPTYTARDSTLASCSPQREPRTSHLSWTQAGHHTCQVHPGRQGRIGTLRELVEGAQDGVFRLTITPKCDWVTDTLIYTFTVGGLHSQAGLV